MRGRRAGAAAVALLALSACLIDDNSRQTVCPSDQPERDAVMACGLPEGCFIALRECEDLRVACQGGLVLGVLACQKAGGEVGGCWDEYLAEQAGPGEPPPAAVVGCLLGSAFASDCDGLAQGYTRLKFSPP